MDSIHLSIALYADGMRWCSRSRGLWGVGRWPRAGTYKHKHVYKAQPPAPPHTVASALAVPWPKLAAEPTGRVFKPDKRQSLQVVAGPARMVFKPGKWLSPEF